MKQTNERRVSFQGEILHFMSEEEGQDNDQLQAGPELLKAKFFSSEYPNDAELERALNFIEYELTSQKGLRGQGEMLVCDNELIRDMLYAKEGSQHSKERVDETFNKYIDCAYGEPAPLLGIDYSLDRLVAIIIIRSVMYYLGFEELIITK